MMDKPTNQFESEWLLGLNYTKEPWDHAIANMLAIKEEIELTDAHFVVLTYLRQCYQRHGVIRRARSLTQALDTRFATQGGLKYLYTLFPGGPVTQGCKLACIPAPAGCKDTSFGTTH